MKAALAVVAVVSTAVHADPAFDSRLQSIYTMSAEQMAASSNRTVMGYLAASGWIDAWNRAHGRALDRNVVFTAVILEGAWQPRLRNAAWMTSGGIAPEAIASVARDLGLVPGSLEEQQLALFVLSRVGDSGINDAYERAGSRREAAIRLVREVLEDPERYAVPLP